MIVSDKPYRSAGPEERPAPKGKGLWRFGADPKGKKILYEATAPQSFIKARGLALTAAKRLGLDIIYVLP